MQEQHHEVELNEACSYTSPLGCGFFVCIQSYRSLLTSGLTDFACSDDLVDAYVLANALYCDKTFS